MVSPSVMDKTSAGRVRLDLSARRPDGRRRVRKVSRMRVVEAIDFPGHGVAYCGVWIHPFQLRTILLWASVSGEGR